MSKRGSLLSTEGEMAEINISPMIDMVFILLIFFIVTTVFVEEPGVPVERAPAISSYQLERNSILIAITSSNNIVYGGREIGMTGIRPIVSRLVQRNAYPVILQVDENSDAAVVVRAIDEAKLANAPRVFVSTRR